LRFSRFQGKRGLNALESMSARAVQAGINPMSEPESKQLLHLVFGGELKNLETYEFRDPSKIDIVGIFPNYESAERAWRAKAQRTVDSADTRYFIVHMHRFMEPTGLNRKLA
jgi:Domain of unknown function (DUF4170)